MYIYILSRASLCTAASYKLALSTAILAFWSEPAISMLNPKPKTFTYKYESETVFFIKSDNKYCFLCENV